MHNAFGADRCSELAGARSDWPVAQNGAAIGSWDGDDTTGPGDSVCACREHTVFYKRIILNGASNASDSIYNNC